jgi:hypothetical protein
MFSEKLEKKVDKRSRKHQGANWANSGHTAAGVFPHFNLKPVSIQHLICGELENGDARYI